MTFFFNSTSVVREQFTQDKISEKLGKLETSQASVSISVK